MSRINIKFFASLREALGTDQISINLSAERAEGTPIEELVRQIAAQQSSQWQTILEARDILVAVNQTLVDRDHRVVAGDEVAFLPPVTGG